MRQRPGRRLGGTDGHGRPLMFDHLDAEIATALGYDGAAPTGREKEPRRRRRATQGTIGLAAAAALTLVAAMTLSDDKEPRVASGADGPASGPESTTTVPTLPATTATPVSETPPVIIELPP